MKSVTLFALLAAMVVAVCALPSPGRVRLPPPRGGNPSFPGYGSFNPRGRRSLDEETMEMDEPVGDLPELHSDINQEVYGSHHEQIEVHDIASKTSSAQDDADRQDS